MLVEARHLSPARVAAGGAAVIALLGVLGAVRVGPVFDLDAEHTVPALWSGLLLVGASLAALALRGALPEGARRTRAGALVLAFTFVYMAIDETGAIHERLQLWTGVDWQVLLAPVALVAACGWTAVIIGLRGALIPRLLLAGGGAAWLAAQTIEALSWDAAAGYHRETLAAIVAEEVLEMAGSLLLAVGLLAAVRYVARRSARAQL